MKERIKELIEEYKGILETLREKEDIAIDEWDKSEMDRLNLSVRYFEIIIRDLEELLTL